MMRSLYSGVSGLRVHQTKMDVIGNNIANVNTIGFKSSSVTFTDVLYQTTQGASGPNANTGTAGTNAMQIGLGASVGSITTSMSSSGAAQRTDNAFDVMIEGEAFFIVNSGGQNLFTKAGSFTTDANGTLCTASGAKVMGWQVDKADPSKVLQDQVSSLNIMSSENMYTSPEATTKAHLSGNIDAMDTQLTTGKQVTVPIYDNLGNSYNAVLNIKADPTITNEYNVEITNILDKNGDSLFNNTAYTSVSLGGAATTINRPTADQPNASITTTTPIKLKFDGNTGKFLSVGGDKTSVDLKIEGDPKPFEPISIDFSTLTQYATNGTCTVEGNRGAIDGSGTGKKVGNMSGISIDTSGKIFGKYDNGDSKLLGQMAVATFSNPSGLEAVGGSMFSSTLNSGEFDGIGQDLSSIGGKFSTGVLEMSNVDLSSEFTEMITTQRGFQANSRIITTSDTLLEELINLKR